MMFKLCGNCGVCARCRIEKLEAKNTTLKTELKTIKKFCKSSKTNIDERSKIKKTSVDFGLLIKELYNEILEILGGE